MTTLHGRLDLPDHAADLRRLPEHAADLDLALATRAGAARQFRRQHLSRPARPSCTSRGSSATAIPISLSSVAYRRKSGRTARSGSHAQPGEAQDRGQGRSCRPRLFRRGDRAPARRIRTWSSSARSTSVARRSFLGDADALLFPIDWPEPFGLVMIEAMACGTPVLAFRAGSVPEVIDDGVDGKDRFQRGRSCCGSSRCDRHGSNNRAPDVRAPFFRQSDGARLYQAL